MRRVIASAPEEAGRPLGRTRLLEAECRLVGPSGADIPLTAMEYDLLSVFLRHPRQVLTRDRLSELAHHRSLAAGDRSVDIRITRLGKKIEPDTDHPTIIFTVPGEGYVFDPGPGRPKLAC